MKSAEEIAPPAEGGEARKGQVARAEQLRQHVHGEPLEEGDREHEHHQAAMHREDLVVDLRPDEGRARRRQLRPDQHGEDAADGEVDTRRDHEADAEIAVIDVGENAFPAALPPPDRIITDCP